MGTRGHSAPSLNVHTSLNGFYHMVIDSAIVAEYFEHQLLSTQSRYLFTYISQHISTYNSQSGGRVGDALHIALSRDYCPRPIGDRR